MKHYKIICITQIYNELQKDNLKRFLKYVRPLCDGLVVYDDASTDGSLELLEKITPYLIKGKKNEFEKEMYHKSLLLEKAKELGADFVFYLDADEVLAIDSPDKLQKLAQHCISYNIDGVRFHKINLWRSKTWQRTDSLFDIGWFDHFWRVTPSTHYKNLKKGLHQSPYPSTVKKIIRSKDIAVLHFGFANEKNLANKYLTYKSYGQKGYEMLDRLISEEALMLKKVPKKLFPKGLYVADEPKPKKKTFLQSLQYVYKYSTSSMKQEKALPLVSIITPTYNRANLLPETMESILIQDYPNIEYIIIDDGSTDNTLEVVVSMQKKYKKKKIVYIRQKNQGETQTVNRGLGLAKGEILVVVNSDDPLLPHAVKEIAIFMNKYPDFLAVYPDWQVIDEYSQKMKTVYPEDYSYRSMLKNHYCMPGPGTFFRKEALGITGGRSKKFTYVADFAFWLKLGLYGQMYHYPKVLAQFRVHSGSQGIYAHGEKMAIEHKKLVEWIFADPDMSDSFMSLRPKALASALYHGASESGSMVLKMFYLAQAFLAQPEIFFQKLKYEAVKLKYSLRQQFP